MLDHIFNSQTKTITFAAFLLGISAFLSRILGLIRDRLLASTFGAGPVLDVYFAAFQIPDLIYGILILGGVTAVFLPMFSEYFEKDQKKGWEFANQLLNCFFVLLILISGILIFFTPWLINLITPGFSESQKSLAVSLTRILFLSPVFFGTASVFSGVLQYFNRFLIYSIAPVLYTLFIIFGILFLVPIFGVFGVVYGVILGAVVFLLIQIFPARNCGYSYQSLFNFKSPELTRAFKLMIPRTIARISYHINLIVMTAIASTLAVGSITVFNFANNLQYFPIGIIGVSFGLASFPALSRAWARRDHNGFSKDFSSGFRQLLFLIIPISLMMFLLRFQLIKLILGSGQFGEREIQITAACLGAFVFGILGASLVPLLLRAFFSLQDTKTPAAIGIISMGLNIALCFAFIRILAGENFFRQSVLNLFNLESTEGVAVIGLPLANSVSATIQFLLLSIFLYKKLGDIKLKEIWQSALKIVLASILMGLVVYFVCRISADFLDIRTIGGILIQTSLAFFSGALVYFLTTRLLKSPEIKTILSPILKS